MIEKNIHLLNGYIEKALTEYPLRIKERVIFLLTNSLIKFKL